MAQLSTIFGMAGSSDTIHFGLLEFPTLPPVGMWVTPVFEPLQTFLFESLDFITSEFVGMAGYAPTSFHDLVDDEVESDGSSIGDVVAPGHPLSWKCAWWMPWDSHWW